MASDWIYIVDFCLFFVRRMKWYSSRDECERAISASLFNQYVRKTARYIVEFELKYIPEIHVDIQLPRSLVSTNARAHLKQ